MGRSATLQRRRQQLLLPSPRGCPSGHCRRPRRSAASDWPRNPLHTALSKRAGVRSSLARPAPRHQPLRANEKSGLRKPPPQPLPPPRLSPFLGQGPGPGEGVGIVGKPSPALFQLRPGRPEAVAGEGERGGLRCEAVRGGGSVSLTRCPADFSWLVSGWGGPRAGGCVHRVRGLAPR